MYGGSGTLPNSLIICLGDFEKNTFQRSSAFSNKNKEDDDFERRFSFYHDYPANEQMTGSRLTTALDEIFTRITQDVFNESLAKW